MNVIDNIVKIRKEKGISQEYIAFAIHCDASNWNKIENGKQQLKVNHLAKIAEVLKVEVIDLFTYPKKYVDASTETFAK
jgi:transcriptional regulator with XRE-family HTH domain